jgi:cellulose biosynthesis protein BcsQ
MAIFAINGRIGKVTITANLGAGFVALGHSVADLDTDPQKIGQRTVATEAALTGLTVREFAKAPSP